MIRAATKIYANFHSVTEELVCHALLYPDLVEVQAVTSDTAYAPDVVIPYNVSILVELHNGAHYILGNLLLQQDNGEPSQITGSYRQINTTRISSAELFQNRTQSNTFDVQIAIERFKKLPKSLPT